MSMKKWRMAIKIFQVSTSLFSSNYHAHSQDIFSIGNAFSVENATYQVFGSLASILGIFMNDIATYWWDDDLLA